MTKKQKKMLVRILITAVMLIALKFIPITGVPQLLAYVAAYLVIGYDILRKAGKGILNGRAFDENFLMTLATLGAFFLAIWTKSGDYVEGIAVMLFYQIGELFQSYAVGKSRNSAGIKISASVEYDGVDILCQSLLSDKLAHRERLRLLVLARQRTFDFFIERRRRNQGVSLNVVYYLNVDMRKTSVNGESGGFGCAFNLCSDSLMSFKSVLIFVDFADHYRFLL